MPFAIKKFYTNEKIKAFLYLMKELHYTQKEAQRLIAKGRLLVNGEAMIKSSTEIVGDFELIVFEPISRGLKAVYETDNFVVFDKPSGVLIHPQNRNTPYSLVDELKFQYGKDANITHRIDQETSGLVLCARNKKSEKELKMLFQEREIEKIYVALVHGKVEGTHTVEAPLLREADESAIVRMVVKVDEKGKQSKTEIRAIKYDPVKNQTLVEAKPYTGRQHQIRVHLQYLGHTIVGDPIYGQDEKNIIRFLDKELSLEERITLSGASRLMLHAKELHFRHMNKQFSIKSDINLMKS